MTAGTLNLMYVEDDPDDALLIEQYLREVFGGQTHRLEVDPGTAPIGPRVEGGDYDLILVDYDLGSRNGLDVLAEIVACKDPPPVVFITGRGNEQVAVTALKKGASDYITKDDLSADRLARSILQALALARLEEFNARAERKLEDAVRLRASLLDGMDQGVVLLDSAGRILLSNRSAASLLGYEGPVEDLEGAFFHVRHHLTREDGSLCREATCPLLAAVRNGEAGGPIDDTWNRWGYAPLSVSYAVKPIASRSDSPQGLVIFSAPNQGRDSVVQEERLRSTSMALEDLRGEAQEQADLLDLLAQALDTPLTPIALQLAALRAGAGAEAPAFSPTLDLMDRNLERLRRTFEEVRLAVRMRNGKLHPKLEELGVDALLDAALPGHLDAAREVGIPVRMELEEGLRVVADAEDMKRVLPALFVAARGAAGRRGGIRIRVRPDGEHVLVQLEGRGGPMTQSEIEELFTLRRSEPSTVSDILPLYLAKGFIESSGGTLQATPLVSSSGRALDERSPALPAPGMLIELRLVAAAVQRRQDRADGPPCSGGPGVRPKKRNGRSRGP